MYDEETQKVIDESFDGDAAAFKKSHAKGRSQMIKWNDIAVASTTLPGLELSAKELIETLLGYLPPEYLTLPHEPFIRAVLHQYHMGALTLNELLAQAEDHVKPIRNEGMRQHSCLDFDEATYRKHAEYLLEYKDQVMERLIRFLGYRPKPEHSAGVEIYMRQQFADDLCYIPDVLSSMDMHVLTIIKYREVLCAHGKLAADNSPLIALDLVAKHLL